MTGPWDLRKDCIASRDDGWRFWLSRPVDPLPGVVAPYRGVLWIMLNPSTARGETVNDPTQRRCVGFSAKFGASRMGIINLFSLSTPNPDELFRNGYDYAVGPDDAHEIWEEAIDAAKRWDWLAICAWGQPNLPRSEQGLVAIRAHSLMQAWNRPTAGPGLKCLGRTKDNWPRHPLYLPSNATLLNFDPTQMRN